MKIPLFPLNLVLLPNEELSLHIFESRYKKMITECLENDNNFGVVLKTPRKQYNIGCTAKIVEVLESYDNGEYDIVVIADMPDDESMAGVALAVTCAGTASSGKTTKLLTMDQAVTAMKSAQSVVNSYSAPSS